MTGTALQPEHTEPVPEDVYGSWSPSQSPDGERIAFVSDRSGAPAVWIREVASGRLVRPRIEVGRVVAVSWSPDGAWLACACAGHGGSREEIWLVRPDGGRPRLAAGAAPHTAVLGAGARHGWTASGFLMVTETRDLESTAALIDPVTLERRHVAAGPLLALLDVSAAGPDGPRALLRTGPRGARGLQVVDLDGGRVQPVDVGSGPGSVERGFLSPDGRTVHARSDVGHDLAALVRVWIDGSQPPVVVAARADAELEDAVPAHDGLGAVLRWNVRGGTSALTWLDLRTDRQDAIADLPRDVVDECHVDRTGSGLLLTAQDWADPRGVWTLELASGRHEPVSSRGDGHLRGSRGASAATVDADDLSRPQLRHFAAADGLDLTGWLYRPYGPPPWPTMIHLHGGPEAQERPVYNSLFQSLVAAGVAVIAPNVRGSTGFGRAFGSADDLDRRWAAIEDVAACARYLVEAGVAPSDRIGCMGRSYGGYLTLAALVHHPDLFAVGIDVCGMADFETWFAHTEPRIAAAAVTKYGHPVRDRALLAELSPIHRIDRLRAPLLVVHGAEDTNVPVEEAEQVVAALAARGVPHRYLLFEGEGHELLATPNRVAFVQAAVTWTRAHLL